MIRYGPAGWDYADWKGIVYPDPKPKGFDPLEYLAGYFDTIEVNSTFYRPAAPTSAESWLRRVGHNPNFRFTAKLWKRFTHERKEAWTADEVAQVRAGLDPMLEAGRLGALLLQFPWSFRRNDESREWLDDLARTFTDFPLVVEVRHASWNEPAFFRALADRGIGFVNIDQPVFKDSIRPTAHVTAATGYVRVHGRNYQDWWREKAAPHERYDYLYSADELEPWAARAGEIAEDPATEEVFIVTNNHYQGKAVTNALMLQSMVEKKPVPAPEPLFERYGKILEGYAVPTAPRDA
ncbi:MAG: DUF72 domain-containing protein [Gemmatimonadetes bacterium]|nr:DUF72 domain-containing protein [Gemmatimonadota bacterium]